LLGDAYPYRCVRGESTRLLRPVGAEADRVLRSTLGADLVDIDAADELSSVDLDATAGDDLFDSRVLPGQLLDHHAHAVRGQVERPGEPRHDLQRGRCREAVDVTRL